MKDVSFHSSFSQIIDQSKRETKMPGMNFVHPLVQLNAQIFSQIENGECMCCINIESSCRRWSSGPNADHTSKGVRLVKLAFIVSSFRRGGVKSPQGSSAQGGCKRPHRFSGGVHTSPNSLVEVIMWRFLTGEMTGGSQVSHRADASYSNVINSTCTFTLLV